MSIKELDISPGSVFQIAVTPTLMSTTPDAIDRFTPSDRGCYREKELPLKVNSGKLCVYNLQLNVNINLYRYIIYHTFSYFFSICHQNFIGTKCRIVYSKQLTKLS